MEWAESPRGEIVQQDMEDEKQQTLGLSAKIGG